MKDKGFTLIELLIALSLFVLSILLLFQLVVLAMRVNVVNAKRNIAIMTAFTESEKVKAKRFEDLKDEFTTVYKDGTFYFVQKIVKIPRDKDGSIIPEMREIKIGVYWGMERAVGYGGSYRKEFEQCMEANKDIEQCKSYPHHSYEHILYIAEAL